MIRSSFSEVAQRWSNGDARHRSQGPSSAPLRHLRHPLKGEQGGAAQTNPTRQRPDEDLYGRSETTLTVEDAYARAREDGEKELVSPSASLIFENSIGLAHTLIHPDAFAGPKINLDFAQSDQQFASLLAGADPDVDPVALFLAVDGQSPGWERHGKIDRSRKVPGAHPLLKSPANGPGVGCRLGENGARSQFSISPSKSAARFSKLAAAFSVKFGSVWNAVSRACGTRLFVLAVRDV